MQHQPCTRHRQPAPAGCTCAEGPCALHATHPACGRQAAPRRSTDPADLAAMAADIEAAELDPQTDTPGSTDTRAEANTDR